MTVCGSLSSSFSVESSPLLHFRDLDIEIGTALFYEYKIGTCIADNFVYGSVWLLGNMNVNLEMVVNT